MIEGRSIGESLNADLASSASLLDAGSIVGLAAHETTTPGLAVLLVLVVVRSLDGRYNGGKLVLAQPISQDMGSSSTDLLVRVDGDPAAFIARLAQAGVTAGPSRDEEARAFGEIAVQFSGDQTYDLVRDTAVELGMAMRSLRTRERSLEDLYLGQIEGITRDGANDGRV